MIRAMTSDTLELQDVDKRRQADQAYDAIATLQLRPGAPVVESDLVARIGLGRTPTREALMRLVASGLIAQLPRRGLLVSDIPLAEHLDLLEARRPLERLIASCSARRASPAQRAELRACAARMADAAERHDLDAYMRVDQALDRVNHTACRNRYAVAAVVPMIIQCRRFWYAYRHLGDVAAGADAIAGGDGEAAAQASDALMDHLRGFTQQVIA